MDTNAHQSDSLAVSRGLLVLDPKADKVGQRFLVRNIANELVKGKSHIVATHEKVSEVVAGGWDRRYTAHREFIILQRIDHVITRKCIWQPITFNRYRYNSCPPF